MFYVIELITYLCLLFGTLIENTSVSKQTMVNTENKFCVNLLRINFKIAFFF